MIADLWREITRESKQKSGFRYSDWRPHKVTVGYMVELGSRGVLDESKEEDKQILKRTAHKFTGRQN